MRNTAIIRQILRANGIGRGYSEMFTNKYKNCRTVKAYLYRDNNVERAKEMILDEVPEATFKTVEGLYSAPSFIVRVPRTY